MRITLHPSVPLFSWQRIISVLLDLYSIYLIYPTFHCVFLEICVLHSHFHTFCKSISICPSTFLYSTPSRHLCCLKLHVHWCPIQLPLALPLHPTFDNQTMWNLHWQHLISHIWLKLQTHDPVWYPLHPSHCAFFISFSIYIRQWGTPGLGPVSCRF